MDWQTTIDGDWELTNNRVALIDGAEETRQIIREHLRTFLGEYFLDTTLGIPYFQTIMEKGVSIQTVEAVFRSAILACAGVIDFLAFELTLDKETRELTLEFTVSTDNGPVTVKEVV